LVDAGFDLAKRSHGKVPADALRISEDLPAPAVLLVKLRSESVLVY
jgi:hypothetical protein